MSSPRTPQRPAYDGASTQEHRAVGDDAQESLERMNLMWLNRSGMSTTVRATVIDPRTTSLIA
jgi:hypothetical protein